MHNVAVEMSLKVAKTIGLVVLLFGSFAAGLYADPQIAAVQEKLKAKGLYAGEVDGNNSNQTAASIARYQSRSGLEVTGTLNEETVHSLGLVHSEAMSPSATPPSPA
ncbi:MAG TPA: peptidoglycan-binding domain-containing protein, partial [Terrimicrobiaceae bacterium]